MVLCISYHVRFPGGIGFLTMGAKMRLDYFGAAKALAVMWVFLCTLVAKMDVVQKGDLRGCGGVPLLLYAQLVALFGYDYSGAPSSMCWD